MGCRRLSPGPLSRACQIPSSSLSPVDRFLLRRESRAETIARFRGRVFRGSIRGRAAGWQNPLLRRFRLFLGGSILRLCRGPSPRACMLGNKETEGADGSAPGGPAFLAANSQQLEAPSVHTQAPPHDTCGVSRGIGALKTQLSTLFPKYL